MDECQTINRFPLIWRFIAIKGGPVEGYPNKYNIESEYWQDLIEARNIKRGSMWIGQGKPTIARSFRFVHKN